MVNDGINERWGAVQRKRLNKIFLVGGGGQLLYEDFKRNKELEFIQNSIILPSNARFANAFAFM